MTSSVLSGATTRCTSTKPACGSTPHVGPQRSSSPPARGSRGRMIRSAKAPTPVDPTAPTPGGRGTLVLRRTSANPMLAPGMPDTRRVPSPILQPGLRTAARTTRPTRARAARPTARAVRRTGTHPRAGCGCWCCRWSSRVGVETGLTKFAYSVIVRVHRTRRCRRCFTARACRCPQMEPPVLSCGSRKTRSRSQKRSRTFSKQDLEPKRSPGVFKNKISVPKEVADLFRTRSRAEN